MMEIEAMSRIEPIGGELCPVSRPGPRMMSAEERTRRLRQILGPPKPGP
jgi:hypothetical protein